MGQAESQAWLAGSGSTVSEAAALSERLRLQLPVMSKARAPLYPSESTLVLRYSRKPKDAKLIKLIAETGVAATSTLVFRFFTILFFIFFFIVLFVCW